MTSDEADITDTYMDSAYVCAEHADMIVKAVNNHDALVDGLLASKIAHYECEDDPFFSCHATQSSISHYDDPQISYKPEPICNCGADAHNKRIDDLMAKVNQ